MAVMPRGLSILVLGLLVLPSSVLAQDAGDGACAEYGGDAVSLRGTIRLETFPGPPNFASLYRGDEPISEFVLTLDAPFCVKGEPDREGGPLPALPAVMRVQAKMPINIPIEAELLGRLGERVWLYGQILPPASRYDYLPVVMKTRRMSSAVLDRPQSPALPRWTPLPTVGDVR